MSSRTLLLTAWYFPIRILHWQDAVKMIYEGTVDVLAEYDEELRSPSVTWQVPAVVRLRRNLTVRKKCVKFSRVNIYQRDNFTCQYCGKQLRWSELSYDHLVPRARGGRTTFLNIVTACRPCNAKKGHLTCDEAGMFPLNLPTQPRHLPLSAPLVPSGQIPAEWEPFLATYTSSTSQA